LSEAKQRQISVLLVEDEALIRMMMVDMVEELGHLIVAEAASIDEASALAHTANFEIAILDVNVGGERIDPVAEIIASRGLPFIFASGYGAIGAPEKFRHVPVLQKPFLMERLGDAIDETLGKVSEGTNQNDGQPASH
jgi:DNA-binding NtrC family response regulator